MTTLQQVMNYNWNFKKQVKVAPNCRFDEGQALQEHYKKCVKEWLEEYRKQVQQEDGTYDVKMWFYQAVDELEALIDSPLCNKKSDEEK